MALSMFLSAPALGLAWGLTSGLEAVRASSSSKNFSIQFNFSLPYPFTSCRSPSSSFSFSSSPPRLDGTPALVWFLSTILLISVCIALMWSTDSTDAGTRRCRSAAHCRESVQAIVHYGRAQRKGRARSWKNSTKLWRITAVDQFLQPLSACSYDSKIMFTHSPAGDPIDHLPPMRMPVFIKA